MAQKRPAGIPRGLRPGVCWGRYGDSAEGTPALATVARAGGCALARASHLRVVAGPAHPAALSHSLDRSRRRPHGRRVPGADERWLFVDRRGGRTVSLRRHSLRAHRQHSRPATALQQRHDAACAANRRLVDRLSLRRCDLHQGQRGHELRGAGRSGRRQRHAIRAGQYRHRLGEHGPRAQALRRRLLARRARDLQPSFGLREIGACRARRNCVDRRRA